MRTFCAVALVGAGSTATAGAALASSPGTPTITITSPGPYAPGSYVDVHGEGFAAGFVDVFLCNAHEADVDRACWDYSQYLQIASEGRFDFTVRLRPTLTTPGSTPSVDCSVIGACEIAIVEPNDPVVRLATTPFTVDTSLPDVPSLTMSIATPEVSLMAGGGLQIQGSITCTPSTYVSLYVSVSSALASDTAPSHVIHCDQQTGFGLVLGPHNAWEPGPVSVEVMIEGPDGAFADQTFDLTIPGDDQPPTSTHYYLALGDSLVTGYAADPGQGYVDDLAAAYRKQIPNLQVVNLGCNSEVSSGLIANGLCEFGGKSQLDAAEAFIAAHPGQISLITLDIGGNDVVFCASGQTPDAACFNHALTQLDTNMDTILSRLRAAAGPAVPIVGMNYFNPYLNQWLDGSSGQAFARITSAALDTINQHLAVSLAAHHVPMAEVAGAFESDDFTTMVDTQWGHIPINVAHACTWLDIGCEQGDLYFGDDANAEGYRVIAAEFLKVQPSLLSGIVTPEPGPAPTPPSTQVPGPSPRKGNGPAPVATPVRATPTYAG